MNPNMTTTPTVQHSTLTTTNSIAVVDSGRLHPQPSPSKRSLNAKRLINTKQLDYQAWLEVRKQGNTIHVAIKDKKQSKDEILMSIRQSVEESGKKGIGISELSNFVRRKYPNFDTKDFGYSQFSKLVQSIPGLELYEDGVKRKRARTAQ